MPEKLKISHSEPIMKKLESREQQLLNEEHYPLQDLNTTVSEEARRVLEENYDILHEYKKKYSMPYIPPLPLTQRSRDIKKETERTKEFEVYYNII